MKATQKKKILYAGDGTLATAAAYLAGCLAHAELPFEHVPSNQPIGDRLNDDGFGLYILSDYPVKNFEAGQLEALQQRVADGAGLLMVGGWESFHGAAGEYDRSPLADVLPVVMQHRDDRVNCPQPCLIERLTDHPIIRGLPLDRPPGVGGYNLVRARPTATVALVARHFAAEQNGGQFLFVQRESAPLLAAWRFGRGRAAAFTSDLAPHWVGGLVDWGEKRVSASADGGEPIEVGDCYARFVARLARWGLGELG